MDYRKKYFYRTKIAANALSFVPYLRLAGLNGSMVRGGDTKNSDIDFLIVAQENRLYTVRFLSHLLVALTGWRRHGRKVAGRICLNCYLNDKKPDIMPRDPKSKKKVAWAYKYMIPLVQEGRITEKFFETNGWFGRYQVSGIRYQAKLREETFRYYPIIRKKRVERILSGRFGDWVETKLMNYQVKRILKTDNLGETVATKKEIRLHPGKG